MTTPQPPSAEQRAAELSVELSLETKHCASMNEVEAVCKRKAKAFAELTAIIRENEEFRERIKEWENTGWDEQRKIRVKLQAERDSYRDQLERQGKNYEEVVALADSYREKAEALDWLENDCYDWQFRSSPSKFHWKGADEPSLLSAINAARKDEKV